MAKGQQGDGRGDSGGCTCTGTIALRGNSTWCLLTAVFSRDRLLWLLCLGSLLIGTYMQCLPGANPAGVTGVASTTVPWSTRAHISAAGTYRTVFVSLCRVGIVGIPVCKAGSPNPATKTLFRTTFAKFSGEVRH